MEKAQPRGGGGEQRVPLWPLPGRGLWDTAGGRGRGHTCAQPPDGAPAQSPGLHRPPVLSGLSAAVPARWGPGGHGEGGGRSTMGSPCVPPQGPGFAVTHHSRHSVCLGLPGPQWVLPWDPSVCVCGRSCSPSQGAGPETRGTLVSCTSGRCRPRASACRLSRLTRVTPPVTGEGVRAGFPGGRVCVCVHMHVCMCSHVCACIFVRVVHVCVLVCLCVRVCMYVCMHTRASGGFHTALVNYWGSRVGVPYSPPLLKRLRSRSPGASVPAVGAPGPGEPLTSGRAPPTHTPCQVCGSTGPRPCPGLAWTWFRTFLGGRAGQLLIFAGELDSDSREDVGFPLRPSVTALGRR